MKIFNSIRWRLQLWYGLILLLVLVGLGSSAYQLERGKMYHQVDGEIMRRVEVLERTLHSPQHPPHRRGDDFGQPQPEGGPEDGPPQDFPPGDRPQPRGNTFQLPPREQLLFDAADTNGYYYIIQRRDGVEISRSTNAPAAIDETFFHLPAPAERPSNTSDSGDQRPDLIETPPLGGPLTRGYFREALKATPPGEKILVGCNIQTQLSELHLIGLQLTLVGGVILLIGLAGGWWLVSHAIKPVETISLTAAKISAGDLSQRIDVAETESELGRLAAVLNSTFARLETAFAQQKQFAADAAHELRTPVTVILTQTQMSLNRERTAEDYKQTVLACQRAAQRMRRLIESLLELARYDAGQEVLKRMPFDLAWTVNESLELVKPIAEENDIKLVTQLSSLEVIGDPERLAQVVMNLLTNAIQYNRPGGEVTARLERQANLAVLTITDTGLGIAPADLPRVFERFYRADKSRTGGGNTGLGLSICKAIVEAHSGTLEVTSQFGTGTTFTLRLPV